MQAARRLTWFIMLTSTLFVIVGAIWLAGVYVMSFVALPDSLDRLAASISAATDIPLLKRACLSMATLTENDRHSRINFIVGSGAMVLILGMISSIASLRLLIVLNRISKQLGGTK